MGPFIRNFLQLRKLPIQSSTHRIKASIITLLAEVDLVLLDRFGRQLYEVLAGQQAFLVFGSPEKETLHHLVHAITALGSLVLHPQLPHLELTNKIITGA